MRSYPITAHLISIFSRENWSTEFHETTLCGAAYSVMSIRQPINVEFRQVLESSENMICVTCNKASIEEKSRFSIGTNRKCFQTDYHRGMKCSSCNSFICQHCIYKFKYKIQSEQHLFHRDMHQFIKSINEYNPHLNFTDDEFVGHCCILKLQDHSITQQPTKIHPHHKSHHMSNNIHQQTIQPSVKKNTNHHIKLGGSIVYEQCRLIVPSSFKNVDCMALGKEINLPAITHFVLDEYYTSSLKFTGTIIQKTLPSNWLIEIKRNIKINAPFYKKSKIYVSSTIFSIFLIIFFYQFFFN